MERFCTAAVQAANKPLDEVPLAGNKMERWTQKVPWQLEWQFTYLFRVTKTVGSGSFGSDGWHWTWTGKHGILVTHGNNNKRERETHN